MPKTKRLRTKIIKILMEYESLATSEIFNHLNNSCGPFGLRHGCVMGTLNNVLGKEPVFLKMVDSESENAPRIAGADDCLRANSLWSLNRSLLAEAPSLVDPTVNSFLRHRVK